MGKGNLGVGSIVVVGCSLLLGSEALARTHLAIEGSPRTGADSSCFDRGAPGLQNVCTVPRVWDMSVDWDTPTGFAKTIIARAKLSAAGAVTCTYQGLDSTGALIVTMPFPAFAVGGVVASTITVPNVPGSSYGRVTCTLGASGSGHLLGFDYFAP